MKIFILPVIIFPSLDSGVCFICKESGKLFPIHVYYNNEMKTQHYWKGHKSQTFWAIGMLFYLFYIAL